MTDQPKPGPWIDKHGAGWCLPNCLLWKSDGLTPACSFSYHTGSHICEPHAREAAEALKAMEAVRKLKLSVMPTNPDIEPTRWYVRDQRGRMIHFGVSYSDPAEAILKAAEAAEKGV